MNRAQAHRGPDGEGIWIQDEGKGAPYVAFGHRRLSIIDLSDAASQPMSNEDGSIWITYNGEVYNYREIRSILQDMGHRFRSKSDTEVIIHAYEEWGTDCLDRLRGMFAFGIWNSRQRELFLARDRVGIKPLVYAWNGQRLIFASEITALLSDPSIGSDVDERAIIFYLTYLTVPTEECAVQGVKKLPPGHFLVLNNGRLRSCQYWDVPDERPLDSTEEEIDAAMEAVLSEAVDSHLIADVPVGTFLSGGIDSSLITALAARNSHSPLSTFSVSFPEDPNLDEGPIAEYVARQLSVPNTKIEVRNISFLDELDRFVAACDEPMAVSSAFALLDLSEETAKQLKVVLSGDGGDECFGGYSWHYSYIDDCLEHRPESVRRAVGALLGLILGMTSELLSQNERISRAQRYFQGKSRSNAERYFFRVANFRPDELNELLVPDLVTTVTRDELIARISQPFYRRSEASLLWRRLYTDIKTSLVDEMLTKVDRMTMASGLEARVPFLDHKVLEMAMRLPDCFKICPQESGKVVLRRMAAKYFPRSITERRKQGFTPALSKGFAGQLGLEVESILLASDRISQYVAKKGVSRLCREHRTGVRDNSNKIFSLLVMDCWLSHLKSRSFP